MVHEFGGSSGTLPGLNRALDFGCSGTADLSVERSAPAIGCDFYLPFGQAVAAKFRCQVFVAAQGDPPSSSVASDDSDRPDQARHNFFLRLFLSGPYALFIFDRGCLHHCPCGRRRRRPLKEHWQCSMWGPSALYCPVGSHKCWQWAAPSSNFGIPCRFTARLPRPIQTYDLTPPFHIQFPVRLRP